MHQIGQNCFKFIIIVMLASLSQSLVAKVSLSYLHQENIGETINGEASNWAGLSINSNTENNFFNHHVDLQARIATDSGSYQVSLPEVYASLTGGYGELAVGRKIVEWSSGDGEWGLANTNANKGIKYLDFAQEGLFGIHYATKKDGLFASFFASFFHLPQVNPGLEDDNGKIIGKSQWTRIPPKRVLIEGTEVPLYFDVTMPPIADLILQRAVGMQTGYSWNSGEVSLYGSYKPESNVRVLATSQYEQIGTEQVRVKVSPFVNHTWVYGVKAVQALGSFTFITGADVISPDRKNAGSVFDVGSTRFAPKYVARTYFHSSLQYTHKFFHIKLSYLKLVKGEGGADDYFSNDTPWHNALGARWKFNFSDCFYYTGSFRYDIDKEDQLLTSELGYRISPSFDISLGFEFVAANNQTSYWYPFRMNDTIYSQLTYSF